MNKSAGADGPLSGVRVLDLTSVIFGSYATCILADLGADVIKIEQPKSRTGGDGGDIMRWGGTPPKSAKAGLGPVFLTINRNKRSVVLDLTTEFGMQALLELVKTADIFASNIRLSALEKLGLSYEALARIKQDLIYVHASGFGRGGAYEGQAAYDDIIQSLSGFADLLSTSDGDPKPRFIPTVIADKGAALFMAYAAVAALYHRQQSGVGQFVEVPMLETITSFLLAEHLYDEAYDPPTGGWTHPRMISPHRRPYQTKDGHITVMPHDNATWRLFFEVADASDTIMSDTRHQSYEARAKHYIWLYDVMDELLQKQDTSYWLQVLQDRGIPCAKVNRFTDLKQDPHLQSVGFFQERQHPDAGPYFAMKPPVNFSRSPASIRTDAPTLGQHTEEVLNEIGLSLADAQKVGHPENL